MDMWQVQMSRWIDGWMTVQVDHILGGGETILKPYQQTSTSWSFDAHTEWSGDKLEAAVAVAMLDTSLFRRSKGGCCTFSSV